MLLKALWDIIEKEVFPAPSTPLLFNQYSDNDPDFDLPGGELIRRENLKNYISGFRKKPSVLVLGEAAGPWGARFSGIPFTGERQLLTGELPFGGRQSSAHEPPYLERSGSILWRTMLPYYPKFILWNTVPFLPHKKGLPLSIRTPSKEEALSSTDTLRKIIDYLRPELIAAVGRTAEHALGRLGVKSLYVRHPSNGGAKKFSEGIKKAFKSL